MSAYVNENSIGIECLHAKGEDWPAVQKDALAWLLQELCVHYAILSTLIDTHGQVAIAGPYSRKQDPTNWPHGEFIAWRDQVLAPEPVAYKVMGLPVYEQSTRTGPKWGYLTPGQRVKIDDPSNGHVCEVDGVAAGIGFVDLGAGGSVMNDEPVFVVTWKHWIALLIGGILWIAIFYGIGAFLWFIFTLR